MRLRRFDKVWAPPEEWGVWTVVPKGTPPPETLNDLLELQVRMLEQLIREAEPEELEMANMHLQDSSQAPGFGPGEAETLNWTDPQMPTKLLLEIPVVDGTWHQQWRELMRELVQSPQPLTRSQDVQDWAQSLTLISWAQEAL